MNELEPLSPEAADFLNAHREAGAPSRDELMRLRTRVVAQQVRAVPTRRGWRMPEVWAVAAVVLVGVVGQLVYLAKRGPTVDELGAAWASGSVDQIIAVEKRCADEPCRARGKKMLAAMALASELETLSAVDLRRLENLDAEVSRDVASPLAARLAERRRKVGDSSLLSAKRLQRALELRRAGSLDEAIAEVKRCVKETPEAAPCWLALGDLFRAKNEGPWRLGYENFLILASADDPDRPRVEAAMERGAALEPDTGRIKLIKGEKGTVRLKAGVRRIAIGDPAIADVASVDDALEVTAIGVGVTTVIVWFGDDSRQVLTVTVE